MEQKTGKLAYIIGYDGVEPKRVFKILQCQVAEDASREQSQTGIVWKFKLAKASEEAIIKNIIAGAIKFVNATVTKDGRINGKTGALSRFAEGANIVILSKIVEERTERTLGYRVANSSGRVWRIKASELLAICKEAYDQGIPAVQNAMYISKTADKKEYLREYVEASIIKEYIKNSSNVAIHKRDVQEAAEADKNRRKSKEFSDEQLKVLKKAHNDGVNVGLIANPKISADCMQFYASELKNGGDIAGYLNPEYSVGQLMVLSEAYESGVDMQKIANPKLSVQQMQEIYERLSNGIWSVDYTGDIINAEEIR